MGAAAVQAGGERHQAAAGPETGPVHEGVSGSHVLDR